MDHTEAITLRATERYVLGDLSVSEVEEFERHFFDCPQCSEELRALAIFQDNARAVFMDPVSMNERSSAPATQNLPAAEPIRDGGIPVDEGRGAGWWHAVQSIWRNPWAVAPALAAILVAVFAGFQAGERQALRGPQTVSEYALYAASRGEETVVAPPAGAQFYTMYMDRTWDREFPSYRGRVVDDPRGAERYSMSLAAPAPGSAIHVLTPAHALPAGRYVLVISGIDAAGAETEVARYPFTLKLE